MSVVIVLQGLSSFTRLAIFIPFTSSHKPLTNEMRCLDEFNCGFPQVSHTFAYQIIFAALLRVVRGTLWK